MTYGEETPAWKFGLGMFIGLLLVAGAIHSTYLENKHEAETEAAAFQKSGCVIYKDYRGMDVVPVKCNNDFVEHEVRKGD